MCYLIMPTKVREQAKEIVALRAECEGYGGRMRALEVEVAQQVEQVSASGVIVFSTQKK